MVVETRRIAVPGGELEVLLAGAVEYGGTVVCSAHPVDPMPASLLAEVAGVPVVCVNPRGVGASSVPADSSACTLDRIVEDLERVRAALGLAPWVFWGMSGGSFVGQVYARRGPAALAGLVLGSAGPCFRQTVADAACVLSPRFPAWRAGLAAVGLLAEPATGMDVESAPGETAWEPVAGVGWVFRRVAGPALLVSPAEPSTQMRRMMPAFFELDARGWLAAVSVPTLVMCGTADPVVPLGYARAVHDAIASSDFAAVEGAGHVPVVEQPGQVTAAVRRFLADRVAV